MLFDQDVMLSRDPSPKTVLALPLVGQTTPVTCQHVLLKLLDWPFLLFLILCAVLVLFRQQLAALFSRGDISISWGEGRSIELRQLSNHLDEELDPLRDEIECLKQGVAELQAQAGVPDENCIVPSATQALSAEEEEQVSQRMQQALQSGEYRWRSLERLAAVSGVPEGEALKVLRSHPDVVLGTDKSGRQIARWSAK